MSNKQSRGKQQIPRKKCNEKSIKVADNSNVHKKRKQPQQLNSKPDFRLVDDLVSPDYILRKVFRKDGPPLGVEFDTLPSHAFRFCNVKDSGISHRACQEKQRTLKRQKTTNPTNIEDEITPLDSAPPKHGMGKGLMTVWRLTNKENNPVKKHGIGKGLMTIQRLINPDSVNLPTCINNDHGVCSKFPSFTSQKPPTQLKKKSRRQPPVTRRVVNKVQEKKSLTRNKKVRCEQVNKEKQHVREICEIAVIEGKSEEDLSQYAMLVDDEELELRELQSTSNPLTCAHCATNRLHGCSLCKDLLAKFPPNSIRMNQPVHVQPWDSSPHLVKKLFKIFHFVSTYAVIISIQSFTLDDLAQAFIDKDSLLLGKLNVALLKLLLTGIEKELENGILSHISKNWKYRGLLQSVEHQESVLKLWKRSLNSLTWIEILRQVLVSAGFGSKRDMSSKEPLNKEAALMASYGLSPGTLKGELFTILSSQGNNGMKVSELATFSSIIELKLATSTDDMEQSISSILSSDITLFEKISSSSYRVRINSIIKDTEDDQSDLEDYGSVDDNPNDSGALMAIENVQTNLKKNKDNILTVTSEIDESNPGEMWLSGLMESEYSDLNIEEKLNVLLALIDLLKSGSITRIEEPISSSSSSSSAIQCVPNIHHIGSGAKIKRSTTKQIENDISHMINNEKDRNKIQDMKPVDSSAIFSLIQNSTEKEKEIINNLHPMQSIFLGSDRRYNQYWIFLGPCNIHDPGHKRIYFESSEDGHWEVLETEEAITNLLSVLDERGRRESHLLSSLQKRAVSICEAMSSDVKLGQPALSGDSSSAVSDVDNLLVSTTQTGNKEHTKQKWCRLQQFDVWLWDSFNSGLDTIKHVKKSFLDSLARCDRCHDLYWRDEKHCRICHMTFEVDFDLEERYAVHVATCRDDSAPDMFPKHKVLCSQLQSLKAAAYTLESCMPEGAMVGAWTKCAHNLWVKRLRRTSTLVELLQVLGDFVGAINKGSERDYDLDDIITSFGCMPQTSSSVALWLVKLDLLIAPYLKKVEVEKSTNVSTRNRSKGKEILVE